MARSSEGEPTIGGSECPDGPGRADGAGPDGSGDAWDAAGGEPSGIDGLAHAGVATAADGAAQWAGMAGDSPAALSARRPVRPPAVRAKPTPSTAIPATAASRRPAIRLGRGRFGRARPGSDGGCAAGSAMWVRRYPRPIDDPRPGVT